MYIVKIFKIVVERGRVMTAFTPSGVYPALPTPMDEDDSINYDALDAHLAYLEEAGVQGVVPAGCTGHAASLYDEERVDYVSYIAETTDLPVVAGDGKPGTAQTIELARRMEDAGADAHLVITPYQNKPTQEGIVRHYERVAGAVENPVIAYNVPSRTGVNIEPETTRVLADIPGVVGIKEASGDPDQIATVGSSLEGKDMALGSGDDGLNDHVFWSGGTFTVSVTANIHPEPVVATWDYAANHDACDAAEQLNEELNDLHDAMFLRTNPVPVHDALNRMGFDYGTPRAPLDEELGGAEGEELERVMRDYGLI